MTPTDPVADYLAHLHIAGYPRTRSVREGSACVASLAPTSRKTCRAYLQGFFGWAVEERLITASPAAALPPVWFGDQARPTVVMNGPLEAYNSRLTLAGYRPATLRARRFVLAAFGASIAPRGLIDATRGDAEAFLSRPLSAESRRAYKASGYDLLTTSRLLRHASVATTQTYARLDEARPSEVVHLVNVSLGR